MIRPVFLYPVLRHRYPKVNREAKHISLSHPIQTPTTKGLSSQLKVKNGSPKLKLEHSLLTVDIALPSMCPSPGVHDLRPQPKERIYEN